MLRPCSVCGAPTEPGNVLCSRHIIADWLHNEYPETEPMVCGHPVTSIRPITTDSGDHTFYCEECRVMAERLRMATG